MAIAMKFTDPLYFYSRSITHPAINNIYPARDIVHDKGNVRTSEIHGDQALKSFLASSVPDLIVDHFIVYYSMFGHMTH